MPQETTIPTTNNYAGLKIGEIIIGPRHRQDLGDIAALAKSIREVGLLHPIVVTPDRKLIAGRRRLEAAKGLGWEEVSVHVVQGLDDALLCLRAERDENECRKQFSPSEAVAIGKALEELEKPKAASRKRDGAKKGGQANRAKKRAEANEAPCNYPGASSETTNGPVPSEPATSEPETPAPERRVRDEVAGAVGMSGRNYEKAKMVVDAAEENPEQFGDVKAGMDRTGKVDPAYKKVRERKAASGQADLQKDKSSSTEEQPARKKGKQRRDRDEVIQSWERQPNESGQEWFDRLRALNKKDKICLNREFKEREKEAWKCIVFDFDSQVFEVATIFIDYRDERWPKEFHPQFAQVIRKALEFADKTKQELDAAFDKPVDDV